MTPRAFAIAAAVLALAALCPAATSAQSATITGRVTAQGTDAPLPDSRVLITGTSIVTTTSADGRYTLRGIPAGVADIHVLRVGYQEQKRSLTIAAGQSVTADFAMATAIVNLAEVVTTATGEQRRVEIGNSVSTVDAAARAQEAPIADIGTLLIGQAPGVQVQTSNTLGVGARIRIRGVNSLSLSNDPIYIVDGVRITSSNGSLSGNIFTGGAAQSRANDINPDEIENIEIVKGPSAATLYGTDAANGVIVITTKRGRAGAAQYHVFGESGVSHDFNTYPTAYTLVGKAPGATVEKQCFLTQISLGTCVADSLRSFNLFDNPNTTPLHNGYRQNGGLQVSGGSDAVRFFTSGELERQTGVETIPQFDRQRLDTLNITTLDEWLNPSYLGRGTFRANVNATLSPKLDAALSAGFITSTTRLPQNDNDAFGLGSNAFGGPGFEGSGPGITGVSTLGLPAARIPRKHAGGKLSGDLRPVHQPLHRQHERQLASNELAHQSRRPRPGQRRTAGSGALPRGPVRRRWHAPSGLRGRRPHVHHDDNGQRHEHCQLRPAAVDDIEDARPAPSG